jgi:hypothetical protein
MVGIGEMAGGEWGMGNGEWCACAKIGAAKIGARQIAILAMRMQTTRRGEDRG